jgi:transcriptional antiterminator RfaH
MSNWYLIHTKVHSEALALENLEHQGYECFLPTMLTEKLRRGKLKVIQEALFPRYLFIRLDAGLQSQSWLPIRSTPGVSRLVMFGQTPAKIDAQIIDAMRNQSQLIKVQQHYFNHGDYVMINAGIFKDVEAVYQMSDGKDRVMVLLNLLKKPVKVYFSPAYINKASWA